jgi:hypothetical protein
MGSQKCGVVGKSQSVLIMTNPIIFTRTRMCEADWFDVDRPGQPMSLLHQLHVDSILLGGNSFDSLLPFVPEAALPGSTWSWREWMMGELGLNGFSLDGATSVMDQYHPSRYLHGAEYRGSLAQCDADLVIVCPAMWFARALAQHGRVRTRVYHFSYGPSCADVARLMWSHDGDPSSFPYYLRVIRAIRTGMLN